MAGDQTDDVRQSEIEEIRRLREIQEIKNYRAKANAKKPDDWDSLAHEIADTGFGVVGAIGSGLTAITDSIGRPIRAGIETLSTDKPFDEAYKNPPEWKELYGRAGLSQKNFGHLPLIKDPWGKTKDDKYVGVSEAGIASGLTEAAIDPLTYTGPAAKLGGMGLRGAKKLGGQVVTKTGRIVTGVREPIAREYLKRYLELKRGVPTVEELRGSIDAAARDVTEDVAAATNRHQSAENALGEKYSARRKELEGKTTTLSEARSIMEDLNHEKAVLGALSEQADDALVRSGVEFSRDHLIELIDQVGSDIGEDIIGDQAKAAVAKLTDTRERLAGLPEMIPAQRLRNILKQIRKDIDFDLNAGEFNTDLNAARKKFSRGVSKALKDTNRQYSAYMDRMSSLADSLGNMSQNFGTEQAGITSMEAVRRGKSPASQVIDDRIREYAKATGRTDLIQKLDEFASNRALAQRMKEGDLRSELFPSDWKNLKEFEADKAMADSMQKGVKRVTPERSQSIISSQSRQNPSLLDREHLQRLGHTSGDDFVRQIENRNIADSFNKDGTRGSRMAVVGGTAGTAIATGVGANPFIGGAIGTATGAAIDRYGGHLYQGLLNLGGFARESVEPALKALNEGRLGKFKPYIEKAAREGARSLVVTHHLLMQNYPEYAELIRED